MADYCEQLLEEKKENRAIRIQHHQEKIAATNQLTDVLRELISHATQKRQSWLYLKLTNFSANIIYDYFNMIKNVTDNLYF